MNRPDSKIHHVGIFGRRLSGKSQLAVEIVTGYRETAGWNAIVLAPNSKPGDWPAWAWVSADREAWLAKADASWGCNVVCDDASSTINRDRELTRVFTCIGHRAHRLIAIGHGPADLTPTMRRQLTEVFLFQQSFDEAATWISQFADANLQAATGLDYARYQFLHKVMGQPHRCFQSTMIRGRLSFSPLPEPAPVSVPSPSVPFRPVPSPSNSRKRRR